MNPVSREGYKFCQELCVPCYQTDEKLLLRPAAFMDMAQEIAYWAAQELGFGYDTLHVHHTAWVLSRMHVHFAEPVLWREAVLLYTWHKGARGPFYLRDFELCDASGHPRVSATSSWVVINEESRRMVRPEELGQFLRIDYQVADAIGEPAPKIVLPAAMEAAGEHTVLYSDIDLIGHTNNVRYVVWALDCLPYDQAQRPVRELYINFNKETKAGETVQLFRCRQGDSWYVEGRLEGKTCFALQLDY